jgi:oligopeptide transport system substrate-binding protein
MGGETDSYYPYLGSLLGLDLEPEATDRLNLSPESLQFRTFEVVVELCRSIAKRGPFVLVIDDLHWLDPTSLQMVEQLAELTDAEALLLVVAQRLDREHPAWSLREEILRRFPHRTTEVRLEGLAEGEERNLLDALVGESTLPIEIGSRLLAAAEGNPFYLEELVGGLIDAGSLVLEEQVWRFDHEVPIHLPETVEAVVMARIDRLDESVHDVLTSASVLGRTFGLPLLHEVVGQERAVMDGLRDLQRLGLVDEARRWPQAEYRFKHALIQEAAYRTIPAERRVSVHRTAAAWLTAHEGIEQEAGLLARHWLAAGEEEQAIPWLLRAGDEARREHALDEAIEHYRSLLVLLSRRGEKRSVALTLFKLGQALHSALRFAEANETFERAFTNWEVPASGTKATATLRHTGSLPPTQPDPPRSYNLQDMQLQMALFDRLVERLAEDTIVPSLAERWEVSDDGLKYLFYLRPGLLWSNGERLTASDVEYGIKRNLDPGRPGISMAIYFALAGAQGFGLGHHQDPNRVGVRALDDRTVEFRLAAPAPFFLSVVNRPDGGPQPQHAIERFGDSWIDLDHQVVSGPFRRTEAGPNLTVLERRSDYQGWRSGNVKRVELHTEPPAVIGDNYRRGERELVFGGAPFGTESYGEIPPGELRMEPTAWTMYLMLRHTDGPASDLRYRRALAHSIDRRRLQTKSAANFLPATGGIVPPALAGHTPDIAIRHDPEMARRLLGETGLGNEVLRFGFVASAALSEVGFELAAMWRETLGLPIEILEYPSGDAAAFARTQSAAHVMVAVWFPGYPDPEYYLRLLLHSESSDNRGHFNYPPFDELIERARRERDGRARLRLFHEADRMAVTEQVATIPVVYARNVTIAKPWVSGWWEFGKSWSSFADLTVDETGQP